MAAERNLIQVARERLTIVSDEGNILADVVGVDEELRRMQSLGYAVIGQSYNDYSNNEEKIATCTKQKERCILINNYRSAEDFMYPKSLRQADWTSFVLELADVSKWHFMLANHKLTTALGRHVPAGTLRGWNLMEKQDSMNFTFGDVSVSVVSLNANIKQVFYLDPIGNPIRRLGVIKTRKGTDTRTGGTYAAFYGESTRFDELQPAAEVNLFETIQMAAFSCVVPLFMSKQKLPFRYLPEICNSWSIKNMKVIDTNTQCVVW